MSHEHEGAEPVSFLMWCVCAGIGVVLAVLLGLFLCGCRTQTCVRQQAFVAVTIVYSGDYGAGKRVDPATDLSLPLP